MWPHRCADYVGDGEAFGWLERYAIGTHREAHRSGHKSHRARTLLSDLRVIRVVGIVDCRGLVSGRTGHGDVIAEACRSNVLGPGLVGGKRVAPWSLLRGAMGHSVSARASNDVVAVRTSAHRRRATLRQALIGDHCITKTTYFILELEAVIMSGHGGRWDGPDSWSSAGPLAACLDATY